MGLTTYAARFLVKSCAEQPLGRTLTIGRQQLFVSGDELRRLAAATPRAGDSAGEVAGPFAEGFLQRCAGASEVVALDFSDYEGAGMVWDLNQPVPADLEQQFDAVFDGGTLEHVFNFPVALANCMRVLRPGGRLFLVTPANSLMGHGFYQFSPELFYRALGPAHGFEVEAMEAVRYRYISTELATIGEPLDVIDPAALGTRTVVTGRDPVLLYVRARKVRHLGSPFDVVPQQSDYVQIWGGAADRPASRSFFARVWDAIDWRLPPGLKWPIVNEYGRFYRNTLRNRRWFRPVR